MPSYMYYSKSNPTITLKYICYYYKYNNNDGCNNKLLDKWNGWMDDTTLNCKK